MDVPDAAVRLTELWASLYNDFPPLQTVVLFLLLSGLLVGGGFALATDRATLRAARAVRSKGASCPKCTQFTVRCWSALSSPWRAAC